MSELQLALDVGTRKVCALLVEKDGDGARVRHWAVAEHEGRAMLDGQVHLIEPASRAIIQAKTQLEALCGYKLEKAHVAVAGRSLTTARGMGSFKVGHAEPLSRTEILAMELEAVRDAQAGMDDAKAQAGAYCVGYCVTHAALDGQELLSLSGHRGAKVELQVLATFLPKRALDSLLAAVENAGLAAASLTLEPIAAVQLAVPNTLRSLNLALVDVGAGTSDIAITRGGKVEAFAMVPVAGDEATERLAEGLVLDFSQAEIAKRSPGTDGGIEVTDLFGRARRIEAADIQKELEPALQHWASEVAAAILGLNSGRPPQAILLAGGGSLLPGSAAALAKALDLPEGRVGHRPLQLQEKFKDLPEELRTPWAVTPLGLAASALDSRGLPFAHFQVNGRWVQVLNLSQRFSAFDALVASGKDRVQFFGRPGLATVYSINGQMRTEKGTLGSAFKLLINGVPAMLDAELKQGDVLSFTEAGQGQDGRLSFAQALEREGLSGQHCIFNGQELPLPLELMVNGNAENDLSALVPDRGEILVESGCSLETLLKAQGVDLGGLIQRPIAVTVEGEPKVLAQRNYRLRVNGVEAELGRVVLRGEEVSFEPGAGFQERLRDLLLPADQRVARHQGEGALRLKLNGEWAYLDLPERVLMNGRETGLDEFVIDGADIRVERAAPCKRLGEALDRLGLSSWASSPQVKVTLNGRLAGPDDVIGDGDSLELAMTQALR